MTPRLLYVTNTTETEEPYWERAERERREGLRPSIASMEAEARAQLRNRGIDPDSLADQGDVAWDLGIPRASVSYLRQQYKGPDGVRARDLEPFPAPERTVGGGGGAPIWRHRWVPLAWRLAQDATAPTRYADYGRRNGRARWDRERARNAEGAAS